MKGSGKAVDWKGCGTALVTPFDEKGRIDFGALEAIVDEQIVAGVDFLVPCGTTGESATLSRDERKAVTAAVVRAANGRAPVVAGAGGNHTARAVFWARDAAAAKADGILSVTPMYNRPSPEGLVRHFSAIADATDLPILVGNEPGRTAMDLDVETILRLAEIPRVAGLKEASTDFGKIARLMAAVPQDFAVFAGEDATALALVALGARGLISVAANEIPKAMSELVHAALDDHRGAALELQRKYLPLMEMNFLESNPGPVKCALALMGKCGETLRLPLVPVQDDVRRRIEKALAGYRLLPKKAGPRR
ncbi:MAG TPA: 4-hydroxy-tetrahydrodipicolinate synthase [Thermoanaerobaculia bacterium]|nr:4-hydroxy-tetrahydrodipicolinate synthase [Thermoanaerobaculia bacterium]